VPKSTRSPALPGGLEGSRTVSAARLPVVKRGAAAPPNMPRAGADRRENPVQAAPMNDLDADYTPRYIWLAKLLRGWIEDGTYPPGSLLPSSARLAAVHSVSRATALHALEVLTKSGHARHVESKPHQVI
jgi:hypothetical protein